ncbi:MAG: cysteine desulfurase [Ruminococcaceae bacterium]|nr:cysteine desulfurase [Oscillospiraceae bacterium]
MKEIYLDNSATTALSPSAKAAMTEAMERYGNPSSIHTAGNRAKELLENCRKDVALTFGVRRPEPGELIFTGSGSEGDNLALIGTSFAKPRRAGGRIISTDSEHPGVENALKFLESRGFEVVRVPTENGVLNLDFLRSALNEKTFLVSLMAVNNETGSAYPVAEAFSMVKAYRNDIVTHTDAVQGYLHLPLNVKNMNADLITVSAHKIHGPKGVGALWVSAEARKRRDLSPVIFGGGQEAGFRSGTENLVGIAGFAAAAKEGFANLPSNIGKMKILRELAENLLDGLPVRLNLPKGARAPHILSVTVPGIRSETILHALSARGIYISNGSACSSHATVPSAALTAFGLSPADVGSTIRVSFSAENSEEDVRIFADALGEEISRLVHIR